MIIRVAAATAAAMLLAADGTAAASGGRQDDRRHGPDSPFGAYLAARHAMQVGDYAGASAYFRSLIRDETRPAVRMEAIKAFVVSGEVAAAVQVAREPGLDDGRRWGLLAFLRLAGHLHRNDLDAAEVVLVPARDAGGMDGHLASVLHAWVSGFRGPPDAALEEIDRKIQRGALTSFFHYHAARILDHRGEREASGRRYRAALQEGPVPDRVALAALAHFLDRGPAEEAARVRARLRDRRPAGGAILALREGAELRFPGGVARLAPDPPRTLGAGAEARAPRMEGPELALGVAETFLDGARMLFSRELYLAALAYVQIALFLEPELFVARVLAGQAQENLGATEAALASYRRIPSGAPEAWDAGLASAALLGRLGRIEEARTELRRMGERHPDRPEAPSALGQLMASAKRYDEAVAAYSEALGRIDRLEPQHWPLLYGRGAALERSGRWDRAERDLQRALELSPNQPFVLNYLAYSWVEQGRRLEEALAMATQAVELRPDNGFIIDSLGWAQYRLGRYRAAVETLERAVAAEPGDPVITSHYGDALWRVGRRAEARLQWRDALQEDPDPELALELRRKLGHGLDGNPPAPEEPGI